MPIPLSLLFYIFIDSFVIVSSIDFLRYFIFLREIYIKSFDLVVPY